MAHPTGFHPAQPRLIQVKRITDLSPHLRCITFHSDTLHNYPAVGRHAAHIKLFLARPGQKEPTLPTLGERRPQWPEGEARPVVRTYTIYAFRPKLGEVDVAFALHDHGGPAVTFARNAQPGDRVGITQPGGPHPMLPASSAYYLAGDPSSLPAIAALLGALPPMPLSASTARPIVCYWPLPPASACIGWSARPSAQIRCCNSSTP